MRRPPKIRWLVLLLIGLLTGVAAAQSQPPIGSTPVVPPPAKDDASPVQHGAQPNPGEVRPGSDTGDTPSAAVGTLSRKQEDRRILGLPVTAALVIGGAIVVLFVVAGIVAPGLRRRSHARARLAHRRR